jgi:hypothetical protein
MSAINVLNFPSIFVFSQARCDRVRGQEEMHVPVIRTPIVSARWIVEINSDGTRRLVEHWSVNRRSGGGPGAGDHCRQ